MAQMLALCLLALGTLQGYMVQASNPSIHAYSTMIYLPLENPFLPFQRLQPDYLKNLNSTYATLIFPNGAFYNGTAWYQNIEFISKKSVAVIVDVKSAYEPGDLGIQRAAHSMHPGYYHQYHFNKTTGELLKFQPKGCKKPYDVKTVADRRFYTLKNIKTFEPFSCTNGA